MRGRFLTLLLLWSGAAVAQTPHTAMLASAFVDSIGINCSGNNTDVADMTSLGISHCRVQVGLTGNTAAQVIAHNAPGAKFDLMFAPCVCNETPSGLATWLTTYVDPIISAGVGVSMIEGPNEVDGGDYPGDFYNGASFGTVAGITAFQAALYTAVKADPVASATKVATFTLLTFSARNSWVTSGTVADYSTAHCYASNTTTVHDGFDGYYGCYPSAALVPPPTANPPLAAGLPLVITEAGATTIANPSQGLPDLLAAQFDGKTLLYYFKQGILRTWIYNIRNYYYDGYSGPATGDYNTFYGAFRSNGRPKVLANTLKDLLYIFAQNPGGGTLATPDSLSFVGGNLPASTYSLVLQKPGGIYDVVLWVDTNPKAPVTPTTVSVTFAQAWASVSVYDPVVSPAPVQTAANASAVSFPLGGDPIVIEVGPVGGGAL